jgi:predicted secreted protein
VNLQQKAVRGSSEFYKKAAVQLTVNTTDENGQRITKVLDSLDNFRRNAQRYQLDRLLVSPDNKSIAILVRVYYRGLESPYIRAIVQTAKLF